MPSSRRTPRELAEYRRKRDFTRTREPAGGSAPESSATLHFVIQKHAASHLHYDLRLELDGVMKSWAVPKGPSLDPAVKRLAMQVEDHPIEYNSFEGTIPAGEYGGGTVMLWDRGSYTADLAGDYGGDDSAALRAGFARGDLKFSLDGERLHGSFVLVRLKRSDPDKPQWLLMKHRDAFARPGSDITAEDTTSVESGRSMEEIANATGAVWESNRSAAKSAAGSAASRPARRTTRSAGSKPARTPRQAAAPDPPQPDAESAAPIEPMLATVGHEIPAADGWAFEPKYDGIRVLAYATSSAVRLITRNGKDKSLQFPEIVAALQRLAKLARRPVVLDGEIVALVDGEPARFQELQSRMHATGADTIAEHVEGSPAALMAFDLLMEGDTALLAEPWAARRRRLEKLLRQRTTPQLRLTESVPNDGEEMLERARRAGWEGVIAKRMDAPYQPGVRSHDWLKLKIEHRQEFVVGGFTEPRNSREHIGALLLGYFDNGRFIYVGHTGGGFTRAGLAEMYRRLQPLTRPTSPFEETPKTNEKAHWVEPRIVVEVKFSEWTADGKLRQPIYLGTRDDKSPREVGREPESVQRPASTRGARAAARRPAKRPARRRTSASAASRDPAPASASAATRRRRTARTSASARKAPVDVTAQFDLLERDEEGSGTLRLAGGSVLAVSNLSKTFFPADGVTKGDVMRYYAQLADAVLPAMADRPLVLKRYPNGITGPSFFQQKAGEDVPDGVRVETVRNDAGEVQRRIIGGDLLTLLYTIQLGAISVDPWHSRIQSCDDADYTILDLDPGPRAPFRRVVDVALRIRDVLDEHGLRAAIKTSGSRGLHIYLPLPAGVSNESALLLAQAIASQVAASNPREATVERSVKARPPAAVYVDYLQNIRGKTVAGAYAVRAKPGATVSTPLDWSEVTDALDPRVFTIATVPARFARAGDIWRAALARRNALGALRALAGGG